ncbi:MAG: methyltransferase domain-containing protein [Phycisphaerales bacterium]
MTLTRRRVAERMDDPAISPEAHIHALSGLARLNAVSRAHRLLWPPLRELASRAHGPLQVLDVASGGGDLPRRLDALARRAGLTLHWILSDRSRQALAQSIGRARASGMRCEGAVIDVLHEPLPQADVVINSLFLHHLDPNDVARVLRSMRDAARLAVGVTDLRRTRRALALVWLGSRLVTRSPVVHHDAIASVRAAHEPAEIRAMAAHAGLDAASVRVMDAVRWRLWWHGPGGATA